MVILAIFFFNCLDRVCLASNAHICGMLDAIRLRQAGTKNKMPPAGFEVDSFRSVLVNFICGR